MKKLTQILTLILIPVLLLGQDSNVNWPDTTIRIFNEIRVSDYVKSMQSFPGTLNTYVLENNSCFGFIFDDKGSIGYRDYCHDCYSDVAKFGTYQIDDDTINITSTVVTTSEKIYRTSIKTIEYDAIEENTLLIKALNSQGAEEGIVFSLYYEKHPKWPWSKKRYLDLRRLIDLTELPEEIFVRQIWVSGLKDQGPNGIWFNINEKWKVRNRKIEITFTEQTLKIVKAQDELILLRWDRIKNEYVFFDKLVHEI